MIGKKHDEKNLLKESLKRAILKENLRKIVRSIMLYESEQSLIKPDDFNNALDRDDEKGNPVVVQSKTLDGVKLTAEEKKGLSPQADNLYAIRMNNNLYVLNYFAYYGGKPARYYVLDNSLNSDQKLHFLDALGLRHNGDSKLIYADFKAITDDGIKNLKSAAAQGDTELNRYFARLDAERSGVDPLGDTQPAQKTTVPATPGAIAKARAKN